MQFTVPTLSIVFMVISALVGVAIPVLLLCVFRKKYRADILPFFIGCLVFVVFALVLESLVHSLVFATAAGKAMPNNIWIYGIYCGLMAGIFEETGRFTAFKTVLKKKLGNDSNALMYGAGHGGFEVVYILVVSMVSNISMAVMLNNGMIDKLTGGVTDPMALQQLYATFTALATTPSPIFLAGSVERIAAVALHISCSVLVWYAVKQGGKTFWLFPLAILLHALIDSVAVIMSSYVANIWFVEVAVYAIAVCAVVIAVKVWKKYASKKAVDAGNNTITEAVS